MVHGRSGRSEVTGPTGIRKDEKEEGCERPTTVKVDSDAKDREHHDGGLQGSCS